MYIVQILIHVQIFFFYKDSIRYPGQNVKWKQNSLSDRWF